MKGRQEQSLLEDYLNALKAPTRAVVAFLQEELRSVQETFEYKPKKSMEIIEEEETDRECEDEESQIAKRRKDFNSQIRKIVGIKRGFEEILNVYKVEMKGMAKSIIQLEEELNVKKKETLQISRKSSRSKNKSGDVVKQENEEELKVRQAPEPVKTGDCPKCSKMEEDKTKWKTLSHKIEEFKKKNNVYEVELKHKEAEIKEKQEQIQALKTKVAQLEKAHNSQREDQQRKKTKKENTNLRGEKVLLTNQLASLRKQLAQKVEINDVQDIEIKKLRLEIDNLNSSLNWHVNNLSQLRNSQRKGQNQEDRVQANKIQGLCKINKTMAKTLEQQQELLQSVNNKTKNLEDSWLKESSRFQKKISELQSILQDKNETIIKLKTSSKSDKQSSYHSDMIKVLNKKLAEKQQQIRSLQEQVDTLTS